MLNVKIPAFRHSAKRAFALAAGGLLVMGLAYYGTPRPEAECERKMEAKLLRTAYQLVPERAAYAATRLCQRSHSDIAWASVE